MIDLLCPFIDMGRLHTTRMFVVAVRCLHDELKFVLFANSSSNDDNNNRTTIQANEIHFYSTVTSMER